MRAGHFRRTSSVGIVELVPMKPRDTAAGVFHVYTHCVWAAPALYRDDEDRLTFLRHLARVTAVTEWTCIAFCLMTTHYHLIVEVTDGLLPKAMHRLNLAYARDFNRRHAQRGRVQFRPYGAARIRSEAYLLDRFAYVSLNPVRAGACERAEDWLWSSYAGSIGLCERASFVDPSPLLAAFPSSLEPQVELRRYVQMHATKS